jgi:hypothetical protein
MVKIGEKSVVQGKGFIHDSEDLVDDVKGGCKLQPMKVEAVDPTSHIAPFFVARLKLVFDRITPPPPVRQRDLQP